jgi:hypothetical protein
MNDSNSSGGLPTSVGILVMLVVALLTLMALSGGANVAMTGGSFTGGAMQGIQHLPDLVTTPPQDWCVTQAGDVWDCAPKPR